MAAGAPKSELVPLTERTEIALPSELLGKAEEFVVNSRAARTRKEYERCWREFEVWCDKNGRSSMPAGMETVIAYTTWMGSGRDDGRLLAVSTVAQALAAIGMMQRYGGYTFDSRNPVLAEVMKGIRRATAQQRVIRRVRPLVQEDLSDILKGLRPDALRDLRDGALIALGWAAALRRSELVGLDWGEHGAGTGFVSTDDVGLTVTLMTSKGSQDAAETILVPRVDAPLLCNAVENWVRVAGISRGTPLLRRILGREDEGKTVGPDRLDDSSVPRIIKRRIEMLAKSRRAGRKRMSKAEVADLVRAFSGHSMRVGFVTSAAGCDVPTHRIKQQTRHKSDEMVALYIREVDKAKNSALKGVGF